jgi:hypothetical protein
MCMSFLEMDTLVHPQQATLYRTGGCLILHSYLIGKECEAPYPAGQAFMSPEYQGTPSLVALLCWDKEGPGVKKKSTVSLSPSIVAARRLRKPEAACRHRTHLPGYVLPPILPLQPAPCGIDVYAMLVLPNTRLDCRSLL